MISNKDIFFKTQKQLCQFLNAVSYSPWKPLQNNTRRLLPDYEYPEYELIYPLLRIGIIEVCRIPESGRCGFCIGPKTRINLPDGRQLLFDPNSDCYRFMEARNDDIINNKKELSGNPLVLLKHIPSLEAIISRWIKSEMEMKYKYDQLNKNHFHRISGSRKCEIYTTGDKVYLSKYIQTKNGDLYKIPPIDTNFDAINIALSYVYAQSEKLFCYNRDTKRLKCPYFHSCLPVLICRALILCDPLYLLKDEAYQSINPEFKNINYDVMNELKRIFGKPAVKEY